MALGEIRRLAPLADHHQRRVFLLRGESFHNVAPAQMRAGFRAGGDGDFAGVVQNRMAARLAEPGALLIERAELRQQRAPRAKGDGPGKILAFRRFPPPKHMEKVNLPPGPASGPGGVFTDALRVDRGVHKCEYFLCHDVDFLNVRSACP